MKCEKKIYRYEVFDPDNLVDRFTCLAAAMEDAYNSMGVKDYTAEDCVSKAFELLKIEFANPDIKFNFAIHRCACDHCYSLRKDK